MYRVRRPGDRISLNVIRGSKTLVFDIRLGVIEEDAASIEWQSPNADDGGAGFKVLGLRLKAFNPAAAGSLFELSETPDSEGELIPAVYPTSDALRDALLHCSDVITEADRKPVRNVKDLWRIYESAEDNEAIILALMRFDSRTQGFFSFRTALRKAEQ